MTAPKTGRPLGSARPLYSALIVGGEKTAAFIRELLDPELFSDIRTAANAGEARRLSIQTLFDFVFINTPLTDEFGCELALSAAENIETTVILLVRSEVFDETCYRVEDFGVLTVAKPASKPFLTQVIRLAAATREKLRRLERENERLRAKSDEIKTVDRAKLTLIKERGMSEEDAHKFIEKRAMDMRRTRTEVALEILRDMK